MKNNYSYLDLPNSLHTKINVSSHKGKRVTQVTKLRVNSSDKIEQIFANNEFLPV